MQRLIRAKSSGCFLGNDDTWTPEYAKARNFENFQSLLVTASRLQVGELEEVLVLYDRPSQYDLSLRILPGLRERLEAKFQVRSQSHWHTAA